jgi:integrin-linked kinase-associated serine/threonine phosphatase 2C
MEDAHVVLEDVNVPFNLQASVQRAYYGVYDGHGGTYAADMTADLLHRNIITDPAFTTGNIEEAIKKGFDKTDGTILQKAEKEKWPHGTTVVVGLIIDNTLYIANAGDSEAVLAQEEDGKGLTAVLLTEKHKPNAPEEKKRIEEAGGQVVFGRVLGSLAVSRALGDMDFKHPYNRAEGHFVSGDPYIQKLELTPKNPFLVIACDGLWDKVTYEEAVEFISKAKAEGKDPTETSQLLAKHSLDLGSFDNVTIIVVYLDWNS